MRENLGQIESRGVSLDYELMPRRWLAVDGGYQYAHAVVSRGTQDYGNWIPEVARNLATLNLRAFKPRARHAEPAEPHERPHVRRRCECVSAARLLPARCLRLA